MNVSSMVRRVRQTLSDNSPAILTGAGIAGCITTGVLAARGGYKAGYKMAGKDAFANVDHTVDFYSPLSGKERAKEVTKETWKLYLPSAVTGVGTIASIAAANRIGTNRMIAMSAAYSVVDRAYSEYSDKVRETIGEKKEAAIHDAVMQDRVNSTRDRGSLVVVESTDILCYDAYTDRLFSSSMEKIKKAQNEINYEITHHMCASLSEFYDKLGLAKTATSDEVGWTSDALLELNFVSVLTPDGKTALAYEFQAQPIRKFWRNNG